MEGIAPQATNEPMFLETGSKVAISLFIVSIVLLSASLALPWCTVSLDTKIAGGGLLGSNLTVGGYLDTYTYGIDYNVSTAERNVSGFLTYTSGLGGDFGEAIGLLKGSKSEQRYLITASNWEAEAEVEVRSEVEMIPFALGGVSQDCTVTVTLSKVTGIVDYVTVHEVWIELWGSYDDEAGRYTKKSVIWQTSPNETLRAVGNSLTFTYPIGFKGDSEERYAIMGMANVSMTDETGAGEVVQTSGIGSGFRPSIQLWPLTPGQTLSVGGLVVAMPLIIVAIVANVFATYMVYARKRKGMYGPIIALIMSVLAIALFMNGVQVLVDLVGLDISISWNMVALLLPLTAAVLSLLAFFMVYMVNKESGDQQLGFREIEVVTEKVVMACPQCGAAIAPDMHRCTSCGQHLDQNVHYQHYEKK